MKTFIPNNKWVMTAALLAVLGLNISYNDKTSRQGFSAEFASSEMKEGEIVTSKGVVKIPYIKGEGDKVTALVKQNAEGQICIDCDAKAITLTTKNFDDIQKLNVDLLKHIEENKPTVATTEVVEAEGEEGEEDVANTILEVQVLEKCEKKKDDSEKLTCLSDKFVSVLKKNSKQISDDDALKFYEDHIEDLIQSQVKEARDLAVKKYRAYTGRSGYNMYDLDPSEEDYRDSEEVMDAALEAIRDLHEGIPSVREGKDKKRRYGKIREELINTEKTIVAQHAKDVKQALAVAETNKNSIYYQSYLNEADLLNRSLPDTIASLSSTTRTALGDANSEYLRSSEAKGYLDNFLLHSGNVQNSVNKFVNNWAITGKVDTTGLDTLPVGVDFSGRLQTLQRGGDVNNSLAALAAARSRTSSNVLGGQVNLLIPETNSGVEFGQWQAITQENAALRDALRARVSIQQGL